MDLHSYLLFVGASIILCIVPGPDMIYLLSRTVAQGKKAGVAATLGINFGAYFHLAAAILGISAIIATSSLAFSILKWCGAAYLIYIGIKAILTNTKLKLDQTQVSSPSTKTIFWQGFLSDVLNPKVAIFFVSLLPQFVQPESGNTLEQLLILGFTVNIIALVINLGLVWFAQVLTQRFRQNNRTSHFLNKVMGAVFVGLGIRLANQEI